MAILPLPQFEADLKAQLDEEDRKVYEALKAPKTLVVRFGSMKMVGEFPYNGTIKPGCGSKVVVRTFRGTEVGEMLTSTCPNSGCSKSVSRKEMLQYIDNSGGRDYPFHTEGRVLRIATGEDLDTQDRLEQSRHELRAKARQVLSALNLPAKIADVEPILGGETMTVYYMSEDRIELRDLSRELGQLFATRVDLKHVGARDEARLTADYEKCGQYCCCKNFLKVLKPISMKSAKVQKATLDPVKISGRCGRLMCCLRYEDQTYEDLRKNLPRRKSRVGTPDGDGIVLDGQILTQLVLVLLDEPGPDGKIREVAVPVENLTPPNAAIAPPPRGLPDRPMPERDMRPARRDTPPAPRPATPSDAEAQPPRDASGPGAPRPPRPAQPRNAPRPNGDQRPARPPQERPSQDRAPQDRAPQDRPPQDRQPRPPARPPAPRPTDEVIDLEDIDDSIEGHDNPTPRAPGSAPQPGAEGDEPRRRRRRRRRGGGGGGPGGGGPAAGPSA